VRRRKKSFKKPFSKKEAVDHPMLTEEKNITAKNNGEPETVVPLAAGDLSVDEDASFALMHMISMEEHLLMSSERTGNDFYLDLLLSVRAERKRLLESMFGGKTPPGEVWCIAKHLLGCAMRLTETGTKKLSFGRGDEAKADFSAAAQMWSMFFVLTGKTSGKDAVGPTVQNTKTLDFSLDGQLSASFTPRVKPSAGKEGNTVVGAHLERAVKAPPREPAAHAVQTQASGENPDRGGSFMSRMKRHVMDIVSCCIE